MGFTVSRWIETVRLPYNETAFLEKGQKNMKKNVRQRLISLLLACVMTLGLCPTALAAEPADHVIINQVYGGSTDGYASHSFIELYNPTDEAVDLSSWSVQYRSSESGSQADAWVKLDLTDSIAAEGFYLIRCGAVTTTDNVNYQVPEGNQDWNIQLHNKGLSVALVDNQDTLGADVTGDVSSNMSIIDLAAVQGNDGTDDQTPYAYEGSYAAIQSKKKGIRRENFADTDNNGTDFVAVDYSKTVSEDKQPHVGETGEEEPETFPADSLTLQPGATQSSVNLGWYAPEGTTAACVKFGDETVDAVVSDLHEPTVVNGDKYTDTCKRSCKAAVSGLRADTEYTYQISNDGGETWSQEYTYTTPARNSFTFAFTSDPQIKENGSTDKQGWNPADGTNQTGWAKMIEVIADAGATLVVSAGDQVEDQNWGKSSEYEAFFAPEEMSSIAYAPAVGNHDRHYMFADHFNLPNEMAVAADGDEGEGDELTQVRTTFVGQNSGDSSSHGNHIIKNGVLEDYPERREMETRGNYYYLYNNVLFITLNTGAYPGGNDPEDADKATATAAMKDNAEAEAMVANFRKTIEAAKADYDGEYDWIIVTHHKSTQTVAKHAADSDIENYVDAGFEQLMADEGVDFVLGGHDHVYSRSYVLDGNGDRASERLDTINDPEGVIYITGNCCSDMQYYTPFAALDKTNNADYPRLANGETGSAAYLEGNLPMGNQEWNQEYSPSYVLFTVEGNTITATAYNLDGDSKNPNSKAIDAFTVTKGADGGDKTQGFENGNASLDVTQVGRYDAGMTNADGGVMEIVDYNAQTGWAYAVNGQSGVLAAIPLDADKSKLTVGSRVDLLDGYEIDVKALVTEEGFSYGDMTSVAVSPDGTKLAVAIQAENYAEKGVVALFACEDDGSLELLSTVSVGVQPDMVTFADGTTILSADEGEPRDGVNGTDPKGSVSIVTIGKNNALTANTVYFDSFDAKRDELTAAGVMVQKNTQPSTDFEPEYIAVSGDTAYVSLQEANAIAVLDIPSRAFTGVYPLGFQDYGTAKVDLQKNDTIELKNYPNVYGIKMPDGISVTTIGGKTYLLTANEGDSRADWAGLDNEYENVTSPAGNVTLEKTIVWFNSNMWDGLDDSNAYVFGGRSFSIYEVGDNGLTPVYDSGSDFETITAEKLPAYFNCSNDKISIDNRSGKKGPEPESVVTGVVDGRTYAFIALERIGGVMVYDITDPANTEFVNYINSREFDTAIQGDVSPEGLCFVSASDSKTGNALLLAACEVSGTLAAYELTAVEPEEESDGLKIAVISDDHLYDADVLGSTGTAFAQYLASDRKLLVESKAILDAALAKIKERGVKYLLIPGDLTKDGEKVNHELLAQKLKNLEDETGIEVFVINGNHDISNAHAVRFTGDTTEPVETVNTDEFRSIYNDFGYGQAVAKDPNSLSYAVDLGDDYRLIAMDACIYNNDKTNPSQQTGGAFSDATLSWVLGQIKAAVQAGRRPIGMMHHGLVPHTAIQPTMFSEYLVKDYQTVAATLADAGMNVVFTGHFHSQDASKTTTAKGTVLYDVETGSLVTSPCPIRYVTLAEDSFSYTTDHVTEVEGFDDFQQHAADFLQTGMTGLVSALLPDALRALGVTDEAQITALCQNDALKSLLVGGFIAHYAGDETIDQTTAAGLKQLAGVSPDLAKVAGSLYTDSAPADCAASGLTLSALPTYPSNSGSSGGSSSGGSSNTTVVKNPDGSTTTTTVNQSTGAVTVTTKTDSGVTGTTVTDKNGNTTEIKASIPAAVAEQAAKSGETVKLPVEVSAAKSTEDAPAVAVTVPRSAGSVKVEIPVERVTSSTVAVIVKADGSEELVKTSVITGDGVALKLDGNATVKIIDNAKNFADTNGHWAEDAIDFVTAREMFAGTSATTFTPNANMTRAQLMTVLARFDGEDTTGGSVWYEKGMEWAKRNGVSDGSNPNGNITREQLATMLWRYAGSPAVEGNLDRFSDAGKVTGYATNAMRWAMENGLIGGMGDGTLNPQGNATRAQLAVILMRYCENVVK